MTPALIRELYAYDRWANRRLFDVVAGLPAGEAERSMGSQWSMPTLKGMLAHILGAEVIWLARFKGDNPTSILGDADFPDLAALRLRWDTAEEELRQFVEALDEGDLRRLVSYRDTRGGAFTLPLGVLLQHVANHSTHHRSEVATMLTLIQGSPPGTDLVLYHLIVSGQRKG
jgi:uncharacterized damage-inducible protein DinB